MNLENLQIVIMVKNSGPILKNVIKSWSSLTKNFTIFDTGSTDGTQKLVKSINGINLLFKQGIFVDFETSRNESLDLARTRSMEYIMCIDDSYFLKGSPRAFADELGCIKAFGHKICGIEVISPLGHSYMSSRLFTKEHNYKGKIHELIDGVTTYILKSISILDKHVKNQVDRTHERFINYDIPLFLENVKDTRNCYYLGHTYRMLYLKDFRAEPDGTVIKEGNTEYYKLCIKYLLMRALMDDEDYEEKFVCYDYMADLFYMHGNVRQAYIYYAKAGSTYPERAGEACFKMYLISGNAKELEMAYNFTLGPCRLQVNKDYYKKLIPETYKKVFRKLNK